MTIASHLSSTTAFFSPERTLKNIYQYLFIIAAADLILVDLLGFNVVDGVDVGRHTPLGLESFSADVALKFSLKAEFFAMIFEVITLP
jgi:hypothetical protein